MRSRLAAEMEEVLEPLGSDEGRPRALALEQRVRGDRCPVREALELAARTAWAAASTESSWRDEVGTFAVVIRPLVDEDGVSEGAADVDAENATCECTRCETR